MEMQHVATLFTCSTSNYPLLRNRSLLHQGQVLGRVFLLKAGRLASIIIRSKVIRALECPGEKTATQRAVGHKVKQKLQLQKIPYRERGSGYFNVTTQGFHCITG